MAVSRNTRLRWSWPQFVKFQFAIAVEVIGNDCKQSGSRNNSLFHSFVLLFQWRQHCVSMMPVTQAIFAAIFLLLMHAIKWIDLRMY